MKLELYLTQFCPFCQLVVRQMNSLELSDKIQIKDIEKDSEARKYHYAKTGRQTVPCLYIDDQPLFESKDINSWLNSNREKIAASN